MGRQIRWRMREEAAFFVTRVPLHYLIKYVRKTDQALIWLPHWQMCKLYITENNNNESLLCLSLNKKLPFGRKSPEGTIIITHTALALICDCPGLRNYKNDHPK